MPMRKISLRLVLVVPFVLQIFVAVGLTGWFSLHNGQKAVNDLAGQLRNEVAARIEQKLTDHLKIAPLVNQINADAIRLGQLNLADHRRSTDHLLAQLKQFPSLSGITIATEEPNYVGTVYNPQGSVVLTLWNEKQGGVVDSVLDAQGAIVSSKPDLDYDHRHRPWYRATVKANRPIWQEPYVTVEPVRMVISADMPIHDAQGRVVGVVDAEQTLTDISEFLHSLHIGRAGQVFIMERDGDLVATSSDQNVFLQNPKTQELERIKAIASSDPCIRATADFLATHDADLAQPATFSDLAQDGPPPSLSSTRQFDFILHHQRVFAQVMPFQDVRGLDWLVVITMPESDFMEAIHANTRTTILLCLMALAIAIWVGLVTSRWLMRPIHQMVRAADALSQGDWQQRVPEPASQELAWLSKTFNRMATQLRDSFATLEHNAYHDALTGLLNQAAFRLRLAEAIAQHRQAATCRFAVLFLDLDYFKLVNDSLGHLMGDQLLIAVTQRLQSCIRPTDVIARFGGDEFVILLHHITNVADAIQIANRMAQALQQPFNLDGHEVFISTSVGIVLSTAGGDTPESFLQNADIALYRAKSNGKGSYEVFDAEMHTAAVDRLHLETDLRRAIERQELEVFYQPIIHSETQRISGFEALVRWNHPTQGRVSPAEFIPVAEETGLIIKLGWWVLRQSCGQMRQWQQLYGGQDWIMSVNLSSKQFFQADCLDQIEQILRDSGLSAPSLKLEITESIFMNPGESTGAKLRRLRAAGVQLSVDDFGTGYSSLSYLHRFPINTLKIDRSFISRLGAIANTPEENMAIVEAIIVMAHKLGMDVVAEGVETEAQLAHLRLMGCEYIQGYLFSPPVPAGAIAQMLSAEAYGRPLLPTAL